MNITSQNLSMDYYNTEDEDYEALFLSVAYLICQIVPVLWFDWDYGKITEQASWNTTLLILYILARWSLQL